MQAVILAAGLGTRMGSLTKNTPKPMLKVGSKNLLELKIESLPSQVDEVILIVGYKSEVIKKYFKESFSGKKITYVEDKELKGTANALWQAKKIIKDQFLVMMGDDLYHSSAILECAKKPLSICVKTATETEDGSRIILENKKLVGYSLEKKSGLLFTGLYCLTKDIFRYKPVKLKTKDEYGLPQTLLKLVKNKKLNIVKTDFWIQISCPEDLKIAEKELEKWPK
jgi:NDP-sugar pyrophosphorylase family protein